jgi:two-component sensor histidine kinase
VNGQSPGVDAPEANRLICPPDGGQSSLIVSDNGVGFPEDLDFRDTGSLGLQLVNTLVDQLEGTIELDRSVGMAFKITVTEVKGRG